jgi:uncharacterized protein
MTRYVPRAVTGQLFSALADMPVVVITGMRQTGKTTLLTRQEELRARKYVSLDDFAYLAAAREDPLRFLRDQLQDHGAVTIDEAQKCPEILTAIKGIVDARRIPGQFLLSGSANFLLLKGITESLAGRAVYLELHPFSRRELTKRVTAPFLSTFLETGNIPEGIDTALVVDEDILAGGMPSVRLGEVGNRDMWFRGFEQTYLERDIRDLSRIGNTVPFRNFLRLCALRSGQIMSISEIGRDAKLNGATASRYLSLLEASFVAYRLSPFLSNRASRLIKSPKLYFGDSGLAAFLSGRGASMGALCETYVAQNLLAIVAAEMPEASFFFWHIQGRHEVDFVIQSGNRSMAAEVKYSGQWSPADLSSLKVFLAGTPDCAGAILAYNGTKTLRIGERIWAMPISGLLS